MKIHNKENGKLLARGIFDTGMIRQIKEEQGGGEIMFLIDYDTAQIKPCGGIAFEIDGYIIATITPSDSCVLEALAFINENSTETIISLTESEKERLLCYLLRAGTQKKKQPKIRFNPEEYPEQDFEEEFRIDYD